MSILADKVANAIKLQLQYDDERRQGQEAQALSPEDLALLNGARLGKEITGTENFASIGLNKARVEENRILYGHNIIALPPQPSYWSLVSEGLEDPTLQILLASAIVSLLLGFSSPKSHNGIEGISVLLTVIVVLNVQAMTNHNKAKEFRKQQEELENRKSITVIRDGTVHSLHPRDLVVGDIFRAKVGTVIPADGLLVSGELWMDESPLTGESRLIAKTANSVIVSGTNVMRGEALILTSAVGERSVSGRILSAIISEHADEPESPLFRKLDRLALDVGRVGMACAAFVFLSLLLSWLFACRTPTEKSKICTPITWQDYVSTVLEFFITSVTVLVVAVPEGLPLAVTLALAVSLGRLLKDRNQVKRFESCETMGSATTICSDKTGTLTENRMKVVALSRVTNVGHVETLLTLCCALVVSPDTRIQQKTNNEFIYEGNPTECALLRYLTSLRVDFQNIQKEYYDPDAKGLRWGAHLNPFSSERKMMSLVIRAMGDLKDQGPYILLAKGAPTVLLSRSTSCFHPETGAVMPLTEPIRERIMSDFNREENLARRVLSFAVKLNVKDPQTKEEDLTFLGWVSLEDPLRPGIVDSIAICKGAGVVVRMLTGDSLPTARAIARQCGILTLSDENKPFSMMTGAELEERVYRKDYNAEKVVRRTYDFAKKQDAVKPAFPFLKNAAGKKVLDEAAFDDIWPNLRVLARCEPEDKLTLVKGLKGSKLFLRDSSIRAQVVAVTGDGTNDAPSLKAADVGFAMGIAGTDVAKQASDVIVLDDSFVSIVRALVWGRNVHDAVCKFLQFQMTVNLSAVILTSVGSLFLMKSPMTSTQMLWVNMIMDSLGSLALATLDPDEDSLLHRPPIPKNQRVITARMAVNIVGQSILQLTYLMWFLYAETVRDDVFYTMLFNTFVMFQLVNELNCKSVSGGVRQRFFRLNDWKFTAVWLTTVIMQVIIVQKLGAIFRCAPLSLNQWVHCLIIGLTGIPWQLLVVDPVATYFETRFTEEDATYDTEDEELDEEEEDEIDIVEQQNEGAPLLGKPRPRKNSLLSGVSYNSIDTNKDGISQASSTASSRKESRAKRRWTLLKNTLSFSSAMATSREPGKLKRSESVGSMKRGHVVTTLIRSMSSRSMPSMSGDGPM